MNPRETLRTAVIFPNRTSQLSGVGDERSDSWQPHFRLNSIKVAVGKTIRLNKFCLHLGLFLNLIFRISFIISVNFEYVLCKVDNYCWVLAALLGEGRVGDVGDGVGGGGIRGILTTAAPMCVASDHSLSPLAGPRTNIDEKKKKMDPPKFHLLLQYYY